LSSTSARGVLAIALLAALVSNIGAATAAQDKRPRLRDLGVTIGVFDPGALNAITDVRGVRVGHRTVIEGERIRTGVTAVIPHEGNIFQDKVPAAVVIGNGFGKLMGTTQIIELGEIESPILLTNTLAVAQAAEGTVRWTLARPGNEAVLSVNAVVGETNDGRLNDIRARTITYQHAIDAIERASPGAVTEGSVGAGTGTVAFGLKGGIGTSSRRLPLWVGLQPDCSCPAEAGPTGEEPYTVGVLVQTNFGGLLTIAGVPLWKQLGMNPFAPPPTPPNAGSITNSGSIMVVVATDAPLSDRNLERLARRALVGLSRTGATIANGSGDYVIAFSTAQEVRRTPARRSSVATFPELPNEAMTPLFQAVAEATEEAIVNSLLQARPMRSALASVDALDPEVVRRALQPTSR
jgi:D-aminopeptidase